MKIVRFAALLSLGLTCGTVNAAGFIFINPFDNGPTITGWFTGDRQGNLISNLANISVLANGIDAFPDNGQLAPSSPGDVASVDGSQNNFVVYSAAGLFLSQTMWGPNDLVMSDAVYANDWHGNFRATEVAHELFTFESLFANGTLVSGSFTGYQSGEGRIFGLADMTLAFNGVSAGPVTINAGAFASADVARNLLHLSFANGYFDSYTSAPDPTFTAGIMLLPDGFIDAANFPTPPSWTITSISAAPQPGDAVPEPGAWAMMTLGFGIAGMSLRHNRRRTQRSAGLA